MDIQEFRKIAYELVSKRGCKEIDGKIYYPEESVMDMLEFIQEKVDMQAGIKEGMINMFSRIFETWNSDSTKPDQTGKK
jgi:hypothetical protein